MMTEMIEDTIFCDSQLEGKERIQFLEYEDGFTLSPKCTITKEVTAGIYAVQYTREGIFFQKQNISMDDYIEVGDEQQIQILNEIESFAKKTEVFKKYGVVHKRGILLHGNPGCGKSYFLNNVLKRFVNDKGLAFIIKDSGNLATTIEGLKVLKTITPDRQLVIVIEEIDRYNSVEQELLNFLDGQNSLQNMIVIATTNNIESLDPALLRPSRFDWLIEFKALSQKQREIYLNKKNVDNLDISKWIDDTKEFTIAQLKELFISVVLLENDYQAVLKKIKDNEKYQKNSTFKPIGFNTNK
jgi:ATP-dependent 26S proteasome regulatory subunit